MNKCLLCKRNIKDSKTKFGKGCLKNIYNFLEMRIPKKVKSREEILYNTIMEKSNIYEINAKQKRWLADRYLTREYLSKIKYGNYNTVIKKINEEIVNINQIKNSKELKSMNDINLKKAYELYKKATKFTEGIENLKKGNFTDLESLRLLFSSFSFIFNMRENKSQYEKNTFKAMQYAFWQTVIEIGGNYAGFDISAYFLQHSLETEPNDLIITEGKLIKKIIEDQRFKETISNIVKRYGENSNNFIFSSEIDGEFPMRFSESDLYFALNNVGLYVSGHNENGEWNLKIKLYDRYDYSEFKNFDKYYKDTSSVSKSLFSSLLYNFAWCSVKFNVIKEYNIKIEFNIENFEVLNI